MGTTFSRLLGLAAVGVAVSADGASAQNRKPSVGVNFGNNGMGYNTQNGLGYGVNSPYYGNGNPYGAQGNGYNDGYNNGYGANGMNRGYNQPYYGNNYQQGTQVVPGTNYYPQNQMYTQTPGTTQYAPAQMAQPIMIPAEGSSGVVPASGTMPSDTALLLTEVDAGGAKQAGLMAGDVILKVDNMRTKTFADLRNALTNTKSGTVKVECFTKATGKRETKDVTVEDGRIGASVVETPVSMGATGGTSGQMTPATTTPAAPTTGTTAAPTTGNVPATSRSPSSSAETYVPSRSDTKSGTGNNATPRP